MRNDDLHPTERPEDSLDLFDDQAEERIRRVWHEERWWFSVIDVIGVLTDSANPGVYWRVLKSRLTDEGGDETITKWNRLRLLAADGKQCLTDASDAVPAPLTYPSARSSLR